MGSFYNNKGLSGYLNIEFTLVHMRERVLGSVDDVDKCEGTSGQSEAGL